ncbi:MAG: F0F1 ATP synthase subunit B [Bacteroidetes bacterium]|nr:F0F1 ATP synthase subunit B [Bacteroidota bacterium]
MELVKPAFGLVFWMCISFGIIFFILKKFAWGPILTMLKERETSIQNALDSAKKAKEEMLALQSNNERIVNEAKAERDKLMKEAREIKDAIISEAKSTASKEADKLLAIARENIQNEKMAAITELKNQVAKLSIEIAEKILREELSSAEKQKAIINNSLQEVNLN